MNHIFYHNDPDGWCSAAIAVKYISELRPITGMAKLHECSYGMKFPWDEINKGDTVYMLDFSLKLDEMERLAGLCVLHWCDHHISAIEAVAEAGGIPNMKGHWIVGMGACELCWEYFFQNHHFYSSCNRRLPRAVRLISMYDVWKHDEEPDALLFQYGIKTVKGISDPRNSIWQELLADNGLGWKAVETVLESGKTIQSYQDECNAQICKRAAFETELTYRNVHDFPEDGTQWVETLRYRAIACTSPMCNSMLFDSVYDPDRHDIMLSFYWDVKGFWTVSVYSTKKEVDCSTIAKFFGGGGHHGASGFQCKDLPFKLTSAKPIFKE